MSYSEERLVSELKDWWNKQVMLEDDPFVISEVEGTIFEVVPRLDSLCVLSAIIAIEKCVDFEIPPQVVKPGGYSTFDEMSSDLLPKIRALVGKSRKRKEAA